MEIVVIYIYLFLPFYGAVIPMKSVCVIKSIDYTTKYTWRTDLFKSNRIETSVIWVGHVCANAWLTNRYLIVQCLQNAIAETVEKVLVII